jgi:hypothetical protein
MFASAEAAQTLNHTTSKIEQLIGAKVDKLKPSLQLLIKFCSVVVSECVCVWKREHTCMCEYQIAIS